MIDHRTHIGLTYISRRILGICAILVSVCSMMLAQTDQINYRGWVRTQNKKTDTKKIALVIGNSEYMHGAKLQEPAHDAETIADALQEQGYEVELGYNLDRTAFNEAIEAFSSKFRRYDEGIVYYAGHGFQIDGENYLIPVDANPETKFQVTAQCINVDHFFRSFNQPDKPKVIILDACRNNPFVKSRSWTSEYRGATNGMTDINPMTNSLLIFSTEKNTVVRDDNPFTEILSKHIKRGGCMGSILGQTSKEVRKHNPEQRILQEGLLESTICFGDAAGSQGSVNPDMVDSDGDLIPDKIDACPKEYGSLEHKGCPTSQFQKSASDDTDGDGISDSLDDCPKEAGPIDNKGCPTSEYNGPWDNGILTDARDGQTYTWTRLKDGGKWMSQNLNYKSNESWCYGDKKKNCQSNGRLYTWDAAQSACPEGWHLPDDNEWQRIIDNYGGDQSAYRALVIDNMHQLELNFSGVRKMEEDFCCSGDFGNYWTSKGSAAKGTYIDVNKSNGYIALDKYGKKWALSCRCISD